MTAVDISGLPWYQRVKTLRAVKGWTQQEAAYACSTTQKVYWNWEQGLCYPRKYNRQVIARAFDVSESDLFTT